MFWKNTGSLAQYLLSVRNLRKPTETFQIGSSPCFSETIWLVNKIIRIEGSCWIGKETGIGGQERSLAAAETRGWSNDQVKNCIYDLQHFFFFTFSVLTQQWGRRIFSVMITIVNIIAVTIQSAESWFPSDPGSGAHRLCCHIRKRHWASSWATCTSTVGSMNPLVICGCSFISYNENKLPATFK